MSMYPTTSASYYPQTVSPTRNILGAGLTGAMIVGAATAACDMRLVKEGTKTKDEMLRNVVQEALGGGLATAAGALVAGTVFRSGFLGLAAMAAVSVGVKYAYDGVVAAQCPSPVQEEKVEKKSTKKA